MDFYKGKGWGVDCKGELLYQFDRRGNLLERHLIGEENKCARIIAESNYIFLIPVCGNVIEVFDIDKGQMIKIDLQKHALFSIPEIFVYPDFWGYIKMNEMLWLLPLKHPLLIINRNTLEYKQKKLEYKKDFLQNKYGEYCEYARQIRDFVFYENSLNTNLGRYLEMINEDNWLIGEKDEIVYGKDIWQVFR